MNCGDLIPSDEVKFRCLSFTVATEKDWKCNAACACDEDWRFSSGYHYHTSGCDVQMGQSLGRQRYGRQKNEALIEGIA